jgi:hypothetical protein
MNNYSKRVDEIVMRDLKYLGWEAKNLAMVLLFVPAHMCWLCFRIMFPWLIPLLTKEDA